MTHVFVEDRNLDSVCSFIRASRHVKYTSVAASAQLLVLGTSNGMVLVFQRDASLKQLSLIRAASPQQVQAVSSITLLRVNCDEKRIAASRSDGGISLIELSPRLKTQPSVTDLLVGRQRARITDMLWNANGNILYIGDDEGIVHSFNSSVTAIFSSVVELLRVDSSVVQLDCVGETLLISSLTRCYLFNLPSKVKTTIGKQLRNGHFGSCFLKLPDVDTPSIYCARRKGRLWEADFEGNVLNTYELATPSPIPPVAVFSYRSGQAREERKRNSCDGQASEEHRDRSVSGLKFSRLFSFGSQHLLARSDSHLCVIDPISAKLILWTNCFKGVVDVGCQKDDIYVIGSHGEQLHEVHFSATSGYVESTLPLLQATVADSQYSAGVSCVTRAIACCQICLNAAAVVKEMLSAGRLQKELLQGLCRTLVQSMSDEHYSPLITSLVSEFQYMFSEWLDGQEWSDPTLNGSSHSPMRQSCSTGLGLKDVSLSERSFQTGVLEGAITSHRTLPDGAGATGSPTDSQSESYHEGSLQDDAISCDRVSLCDSLIQNDTDRDTESIVSVPGSELSFEASSEQHSTQDTVISEKADTSLVLPAATGGGTSSAFRRLFSPAVSSPIDTFLVAKDKVASVFGSLLPRSKMLIDSSKGRSPSTSTEQEAQDSTADVMKTADAAVADGATAAGQQSSMLLQQLLQQTHCVHAAVRSVCGLGPGNVSNSRQDLLHHLGIWSDCLIRAYSAVTTEPAITEYEEASSVAPYALEGSMSWRMQPITVTCPWHLVDDMRRELVSAAMLCIELGCPATNRHNMSVSSEHECNVSHLNNGGSPCSATESFCGVACQTSDFSLAAAAAASCSICGSHGSASTVVRTCRFVRQFFFLVDIKRLASWIARWHCGLEYWQCFIECLKVVEYNKDQNSAVFRMSAGEQLSADETLHKVLLLAKPHGTAASAVSSITSDFVAIQVFLSASRYIVLHPEKVVAFCAELRQLVHPMHVRYLIEANHVDSRHFVVYMDRILQSLANSETRDAFVQEQCHVPGLGVYWLRSVLHCDRKQLATPVHIQCCGMVRPRSLGAAWPHKNLLDDLLGVCLWQNNDGKYELQEAATVPGDSHNRSIAGLLEESGYWSGCLALWRSQQQQQQQKQWTDKVLKCLLQNGDLDWFERETELMNLSSEEWTEVLRLRQNQEPQVYGAEQQQELTTVTQMAISCDGDRSPSGTERCYLKHVPNCQLSKTHLPKNVSEHAATSMLSLCLYCGASITDASTIRWDDLLLLFVKRHGLNKMWALVHDAVLPRDIFTLSFYRSCLYMAQTELQQASSIERIMEALNSYLWSKRPNYGAPDVRYLVDHQQDFMGSNKQETISAVAPRNASTIHKMPHVLLDDAACHWGALLDRASTKCLLCTRHVLANPSSSGDGTAIVFDCAHVYHRHCLLDDRGCPLCISAQSSATEHPTMHLRMQQPQL